MKLGFTHLPANHPMKVVEDTVRAMSQVPGQGTDLKPIDFAGRSANELRPSTFDTLVGQDKIKGLMRRIVVGAQESGRPLDHMLFVGGSGTGKTTLAQVVAHESGRRVFQLKAPVALDVFEQMADTCVDGDVVIVDEIHLQVSGDRRGVTQACDPETFFTVMEDRRLMTARGMRAFPAVTFIGCTTDAGLLPEAFINRFPLRPHLADYSEADMRQLADANATAVGMIATKGACAMFARSCRANPRQLNTYIRNARSLTATIIGGDVAREVIEDLNSTTLDGLTAPMQDMLKVLLRAERISKGERVYTASVNTIATALGLSRDTKNVALFVEPWLIRCGYVNVTPSGRALTPAGVRRARGLAVEADGARVPAETPAARAMRALGA